MLKAQLAEGIRDVSTVQSKQRVKLGATNPATPPMPTPLPAPHTHGKPCEGGGNEGGIGDEVLGRAVSRIEALEGEVLEMYGVVAKLRANADKVLVWGWCLAFRGWVWGTHGPCLGLAFKF